MNNISNRRHSRTSGGTEDGRFEGAADGRELGQAENIKDGKFEGAEDGVEVRCADGADEGCSAITRQTQ